MKGKIVYQTEPMKIEVREHEFSEEVEAGSVLLEVLQTNVCGSELHVFKGHHPTLKCGVIGHEMIGRIAKLGDNVKTDNAGNPVQDIYLRRVDGLENKVVEVAVQKLADPARGCKL